MREHRYLKHLSVCMLILLTCLMTCLGVRIEANAATATYFKAYKKANFEPTSKHYELKVNGQNVDVVSYYYDRFDYAHIAFEGTTTFEIKAKHGDIQFYNVSPHSYNIKSQVSGNTLKFDLTQAESRYLVIKITAGGIQKELFIACDPDLGLKKPDTSKDNVVDIVKDYGIETNYDKADGKKNSEKINQAIKDMSSKGGGTVYFPGNTVYKFVTIDSKDNVTLYLDDGAVLRGSGKRSDYSWNNDGTNGRQSTRRDIKITSKNFSIIGTGMVDSNSEILALPKKKDKWPEVPSITQDEYRKNHDSGYYPDGWDDFRKGIVDSSNANGIIFRGVTFKDATGWSLHLSNSSNIEMTNVKLILDYSVVHADGYDIASCQNVEITNCLGITGDDTFCPKGSNSNREMKNYLFKDCVSYARGGAGCKIGMQAQSKTTNIEFNNIDVIQGYRGFCVAHDDGSGEFSNIKFIDIRTEKIWINNTGNRGGQFRPAPFTIWALNDGGKSGNVHDVEVTRCSFESCGTLPSIIKGDIDKGVISNVTFTDLVMNGRTITSANYEDKINARDEKLIDIGNNVKKDTIKFKTTKVQKASKVEYEGEFGVYANGAKTVGAGNCSMTRKAGSLGKSGSKDRTVSFVAHVDKAGSHTVDIYACVNGTRSLQIYVNDKKAKKVEVKGKSFDYPVKVTTTLDLKAGNNTIKFGNPDGEAPDLDKFVIYEEGGISESSGIEIEWCQLANDAKVSNTGNCSGGAYVGWIGGAAGGTATYSYDAAQAGTYKMKIYYCTGNDRQLKVVVNGKEFTGTCTSNGSWNTPVTTPYIIEVPLNAGSNTIQFAGVGDEDAPNLDRFEMELKPAEAAIGSKVEAELGTLSGEASVSNASGCSNGQYVGNIGGSSDNTSAFIVNAPTAGEYYVYVTPCTDEERQLNIKVNDKDHIVTCPSTGGWGTPAAQPIEVKVTLNAGENKLVLTGVNNTYAPNLDCMEIRKEQIQDVTAEKNALAAAVSAASSKYQAGQQDYTDDSWQKFVNAYTAAANPPADAAAETLTNLKTQLESAQRGLVKKETEQKPTETEPRPTETEQRPTETEPKPIAPPQSEQKPTESQKPTETQKPDQTEATLTVVENQLVTGLGVTPATAKKISALAVQYKIPDEVIVLTDAVIKARTTDGDIAGSSFAVFQAKAAKQKQNSINLSWNKFSGADGYLVYGNQCGKKNSYQLIADVQNKTSYTHTGLKKGTYYKYIVCAYKVVDGTKVTVAASKTIHAVTKGGKYGVAKKVKVKSKVNLKRGKSVNLNAKEVKADKKIKRHRSLNYESTNTKVAKVSKKGKITATGKGTCQVYVYAQNGVYKKVTVRVK